MAASRDGRWLYVVYFCEERKTVQLRVVSRQTTLDAATLDCTKLGECTPQGIAVLENGSIVIATTFRLHVVTANPATAPRLTIGWIPKPPTDWQCFLGTVAASLSTKTIAVILRRHSTTTGCIAIVNVTKKATTRFLGDRANAFAGCPLAVAWINRDEHVLVTTVSLPTVTMWHVASGNCVRQLFDGRLQQPRSLIPGAGTTVLILDTRQGNRKCIEVCDWRSEAHVETLLDSKAVASHSAIRSIALTPATGVLLVLDFAETRAFQLQEIERASQLESMRLQYQQASKAWEAALMTATWLSVDVVALRRREALASGSIAGLTADHAKRQEDSHDRQQYLQAHGDLEDSETVQGQRAIWDRQDACFEAALARRVDWAATELQRAQLRRTQLCPAEKQLFQQAMQDAAVRRVWADNARASDASTQAQERYLAARQTLQQLGGGDDNSRGLRIREYV